MPRAFEFVDDLMRDVRTSSQLALTPSETLPRCAEWVICHVAPLVRKRSRPPLGHVADDSVGGTSFIAWLPMLRSREPPHRPFFGGRLPWSATEEESATEC